MTTQQALAVIRLIIILAAIVVIYSNRRTVDNFQMALPYLFWLGHAFLFLSAYLILSYLGRIDIDIFNIWSAAVQIQGFLTVLVVESFRLYRHRGDYGR